MGGKDDQSLLENVIFIVLNLIFFGLMFAFILRASSGAFVLEQLYAKQIALLLDGAKPGIVLELDITRGYEVAKKNKFDFDNSFKIEDNKVIVQLSDARAYFFPILNDIDVEPLKYEIFKENGKEKRFIVLEIKK